MTYNVRTLAVKGEKAYGHAYCVLAKGRSLGCDFIGLPERMRSGNTEFGPAGYLIFCCAEEETEDRQGLYGVGLAVKASIYRKSVYTH